MAGYDGYSKSNNALTAESEGKYPLTHAVRSLAALVGCTQKTARAELLVQGPCEWHHSSKRYNRADYYDVAFAAASLNGGSDGIDAVVEAYREKIAIEAKARRAAERATAMENYKTGVDAAEAARRLYVEAVIAAGLAADLAQAAVNRGGGRRPSSATLSARKRIEGACGPRPAAAFGGWPQLAGIAKGVVEA